MLILSRKTGESIVIGEDIEILVTRINGGQVHLGISAPRDVPVNRREIHDRICEEKRIENGGLM